ncbi:MAG: FecR domain-containing protein [Candidatus Andeanibacterium colombiense]|uniref:FecR domain-containing protein n=1 Tax=Candidatus Andeanibacterium colombiense TaxID=3121345 RepID=A0AAJ6BMQ1_9SPHN|nr:MAG: FecR domain-containing protein [Sphingomonadaceae bacterium]
MTKQNKLEDFPELPGDWQLGVEQYAPGPDQVEQAMEWLLRLREDGQVSSPAFEQWQGEHPANAFAAAEARVLYGAVAGPAKRAARHYHRPRIIGLRPRGWMRRAFTWQRAGLMAAACLALVLAIPAAHTLRDWGADAVTQTGGSRIVRLADGSRITLNTDTALDFEIAGRDGKGARHAVLRHGEAFFEIAHDPARPFTVAAGDARVTVLGTKFNIRMDDAQVLVSLTQGRVRALSAAHPEHPVVLEPGQQALVDSGQVQRQEFDPFEVTAWRSGQIVAYKTPLRTVVTELNRYRSHAIYIVNGALVNSRVTGVFRADRSEDVIRTLERTLGLESVTLPTGQVLLY